MGNLVEQVKALSHAFARQGGKGNRRQQRVRMLAFAAFCEGMGAREMGQVGDRHVITYWKASKALSDATLYAHWLAIRHLWRLAGKAGEPPRPRLSGDLKGALKLTEEDEDCQNDVYPSLMSDAVCK